MTETRTNSGMDRVAYEHAMADRIVAAAARMRRANRECAAIEAENGDRAALARENKTWRFWNAERAAGASEINLCRRGMREEGYTGGDKWLGDLLAATYRDALRYEKEIDLDARALRFGRAFESFAEGASGASARRGDREAQPLFGALSEALREAYEGVDERRLLCIYVSNEDLRGLDIPEALALAPEVWRHYLNPLA